MFRPPSLSPAPTCERAAVGGCVLVFASQVMQILGFCLPGACDHPRLQSSRQPRERVSTGSLKWDFFDSKKKGAEPGQSFCSQGFWGNRLELLLTSVVRCLASRSRPAFEEEGWSRKGKRREGGWRLGAK